MPASYDAWKLDNGPHENHISDAQFAADLINGWITGPLRDMGCTATADDDGTVLLFIGEFECGEFEPDHALAHWRTELATGFARAMSESRPRKAG